MELGGFLFKRSEWVHQWNLRYFNVKNQVLVWRTVRQQEEHKEIHHALDKSNPLKGKVCLRGSQAAAGIGFDYHGQRIYPFILFLADGREIILAAGTPSSRLNWLRRLNKDIDVFTSSTMSNSMVDISNGNEFCSGSYIDHPETNKTSKKSTTTKDEQLRTLSMSPSTEARTNEDNTRSTKDVHPNRISATSRKLADELKSCYQQGWCLSVVDAGLYECMETTSNSVDGGTNAPITHSSNSSHRQPSNNASSIHQNKTLMSPIGKSPPVAMFSIRYSCASLEWTALRTYADIVEFDITFRRWLQGRSRKTMVDHTSIKQADTKYLKCKHSTRERCARTGIKCSMPCKAYSTPASVSENQTIDHLKIYDQASSDGQSSDKMLLKSKVATCSHHDVLPLLPDLEQCFEFVVPRVGRNFLACTSNKILQHSPSNPFDSSIPLRSNFVRTPEHHHFEHFVRYNLKEELNRYFKHAQQMEGFHEFMIASGSKPRQFLTTNLQKQGRHGKSAVKRNEPSPVPQMWKKPFCPDYPLFPLKKVYARLKPGDIVLFNVRSRLASMQRMVCSCFWDHVGVVTMTRADERLHLLEATQQGVTCLPLRQRLTQYAVEGAIVAARIFSWQCDSTQAAKHRFKHVIRTLRLFSHSVLGNRYGGLWDSLSCIVKHKLFSKNRNLAKQSLRKKSEKNVETSNSARLKCEQSTQSATYQYQRFRVGGSNRQTNMVSDGMEIQQHADTVNMTPSNSIFSKEVAVSYEGSKMPSEHKDIIENFEDCIQQPEVLLQRNTDVPPILDVQAMDGSQKYFCSNLVALALLKVGALVDVSVKEASCYLPRAFEPGGAIDKHLAESYLLGPPILCYSMQ